MGSISFWMVLVMGRNRVPNPAVAIRALFMVMDDTVAIVVGEFDTNQPGLYKAFNLYRTRDKRRFILLVARLYFVC